MKSENRNPHNIPLDRVVWKTGCAKWEFPLKAIVGYDNNYRAKDGRSFLLIAELHSPTKWTYCCHPDNFKPICDTAKSILLGDVDF